MLIKETKNISFLEINETWTKEYFQQNEPNECSDSEEEESDLEKLDTSSVEDEEELSVSDKLDGNNEKVFFSNQINHQTKLIAKKTSKKKKKISKSKKLIINILTLRKK